MRFGSLRSIISITFALIALGLLLTQLATAAPTVPSATFTVTKTEDTNDGTCNSDCSLREAIGAANTSYQATVVVPAGIYSLTIDGANEDNNAIGDLDLKASMTISGAGLTTTIIYGGDTWTDRLMHITVPTATVQIDGLTLREGHATIAPSLGGGLYNNGHLTLTHSAVLSNTALAGGGGLYNYGWLVTLGTTIAGNTTPQSGGGLVNSGDAILSDTLLISNSAASNGGGLVSIGVLVVDGGSTLALNHASQWGGAAYILAGVGDNRISNSAIVTNSAANGGGLYLNNSHAAITATLFASNTATTNGGAINTTSSPASIVDSQFISNTSLNGNGGGLYGGAFYLTRTTFISNQAQFGGGVYPLSTLTSIDSLFQGNRALQNGGGLYVLSYSAIDHALFISNTAQNGGGVFNYGSFIAQDLTVRGNSATANGGGVYNAYYAIIDRSLIAANHAASGGGLGTRGNLTFTNSTLSGNTATGFGGGLLNDARTNVTPTTALRSVTLVSNTAQSNGAGLAIANNGGTINAANSLFAYNTAPGGAHDCLGTLNSLGYNLIQHPSGCVITNTLTGVITNVAPLLDVLRDNGGATWTHALISGSVAIDAGNPAPVGSGDDACPVTDQRGVARSGGGGCDLGAFELTHPAPTYLIYLPLVVR